MSSWRTAPLPPDWAARREHVFERDGRRCTWTEHGVRCTETEDLECDHVGTPEDHSLGSLRTLCRAHHKRRSSSQGGAAAARKRIPSRRPRGAHPGAIAGTQGDSHGGLQVPRLPVPDDDPAPF